LVLDIGARIKDFALDSAPDLIVLFEHRPPVGPIASSTSSPDAAAGAVEPHPAASNPV
jgi:hypothetical protein